jgi:hypothetical protein
MGEYAKYLNQEIKIGTCEMMYYLRFEDRKKVEYDGNLDNPGLFFRVPFEDEDNCGPGGYKNHDRGLRLYKGQSDAPEIDPAFSWLADSPGIMQYHNESGLLVNVNCYHGVKLPEAGKDVKFFWNGRSWFIELKHIKNGKDGIGFTIGCRFCRKLWSVDFETIREYLHGTIKERLFKYLLVPA